MRSKNKVALAVELSICERWILYKWHHEKPDFCICKNKGTDQLHGNRAAYQRLCFCYKDSLRLPVPGLVQFQVT